MNPVHHLSEPAKHLVDVAAGATLLATLLSWLPGLTALLTLVWVVMRMVESWQQIRLNNRKLGGK